MTDPLEDYWADIRRSPPKKAYPGLLEPPCLAQLQAWGKLPVEPFVVVPGEDRQAVVTSLTSHLETGVVVPCSWSREEMVTALVHATRDLVIAPPRRQRGFFTLPVPMDMPTGWDLIWGIVLRRDFIIDEPLRGLIDKRFSRLSDMFRALTEARFMVTEGTQREKWANTERALVAIGRWVEGSPKLDPFLLEAGIRRSLNPEDQVGVLLFLLTLANQNGLLPATIFVLSDLERVTRQDAGDLHGILSALERWKPIGCPLRLLVTWDGRNKTALRRLNPKLYKQVREGLHWIR